jgi:predicted Zn finger-like uncharacterized protein
MILTCPACQTRYRLDDAAIGAGGRDVRCANCGNVWHYTPSKDGDAAATGTAASGTAVAPVVGGPAEAATLAATTAVPPGPRLDSPQIDQPSEAGPAASAPVVAPAAGTRDEPGVVPARRGMAWLAWAALFLLIIGAVLVAILARDKIVAMWPGAARIYVAAHLGGEQPGSGLEIKVMPSRTADALTIDGDITNTAGTARPVPKLRVALRDLNKNELASKVIDPPVERLLPGAVAHFSTNFPNPSPNAAGVAVTFATE